jgi:hypothetical protein
LLAATQDAGGFTLDLLVRDKALRTQLDGGPDHASV